MIKNSLEQAVALMFISLEKTSSSSKALNLKAVNDYRGCSWLVVNTGNCETCCKHEHQTAADDDWGRPCLPTKTGDWLMFLAQMCH